MEEVGLFCPLIMFSPFPVEVVEVVVGAGVGGVVVVEGMEVEEEGVVEEGVGVGVGVGRGWRAEEREEGGSSPEARSRASRLARMRATW